MGSSPERVKIADLGDVIYYRQVKDYSDHDYESSKDLQKAMQRGLVTLIEHIPAPKSIDSPQTHIVTVNNSSTIDLEIIKQAVREVLPAESKTKSLSDSLRDIIPTIVNMVRQEITSAMSVIKSSESKHETSSSDAFMGPEYVPTVSAEGMVSNINVEAKEVSGKDVSSNLDLLRKLKQQSK